MVKRIRLYSSGLVICLLSLFGVLWYNNVYNHHIHIYSNGRIIAHSHPYKDFGNENSPYKSHKHTSLELISIESLNLIYFTASLLFLALNFARKRSYFEVIRSFHPISFRFFIHERAPPYKTVLMPEIHS